MKQNGQELICNNNAFYSDNSCVFLFFVYYTKSYILEEWTSFHKLKKKKNKGKSM